MEAYFSTMFEDFRLERSLFLLLSLTDPDKLKRGKFTDDAINISKNLPLEKLHRQRRIKECFAVSLIK